MNEALIRTEALIGTEKLNKLSSAHVAVFGLGGVGGYAVEALARVGVGALTLVDCDVYSCSNINRQLHALRSTVGRNKVDVCKERIAEINPDCTVRALNLFFDEKSMSDVNFSAFDYVIDAIDVVSSKLALIKACKEVGVPVVSCMGTGNRITADFKISDITKSSGCPLARVMRKELKTLGISKVDVLYSPNPSTNVVADDAHGRHSPASISYVPAIAGLMLAEHVVKRIIE